MICRTQILVHVSVVLDKPDGSDGWLLYEVKQVDGLNN